MAFSTNLIGSFGFGIYSLVIG